MSQFPELFNYALNLVNYATKSDLKNVTGVDKVVKVPGGLNSLESKVDNLDFQKLEIALFTKFLNTSVKFQYFHNASWYYRSNPNMGI